MTISQEREIKNDPASTLVVIEKLKAENDKLMLALRDADNVAKTIDDQIALKTVDARSPIADARLDYGTPFIYKWI